MAIFEKTIRNKNFDKLLRKLENEIPDSSWSADLEAGSDFKEGDARCSVRVFERYSMMGGNRLSLTLTMFQNGDSPIRLSAITASGSQAVFFKVNTLGEESFLEHGQCQTQAVAAHHAVPFKYTDTAPGIALFEITACL